MSRLFTEMAGAVIDELEPQERTLVDPKVFARIIGICATVAEHSTACPLACMPTPPAMQHINANLLVPGDHVWRDDLSFDVVKSVNQDGDEVVITLAPHRSAPNVSAFMVRAPKDPIRVAVSNDKARQWNDERVYLDEETVRSLYAAYGAY